MTTPATDRCREAQIDWEFASTLGQPNLPSWAAIRRSIVVLAIDGMSAGGEQPGIAGLRVRNCCATEPPECERLTESRISAGGTAGWTTKKRPPRDLFRPGLGVVGRMHDHDHRLGDAAQGLPHAEHVLDQRGRTRYGSSSLGCPIRWLRPAARNDREALPWAETHVGHRRATSPTRPPGSVVGEHCRGRCPGCGGRRARP